MHKNKFARGMRWFAIASPERGCQDPEKGEACFLERPKIAGVLVKIKWQLALENDGWKKKKKKKKKKKRETKTRNKRQAANRQKKRRRQSI